MCYFITIAVSNEHVDQLGQLVQRGFALTPVENPSVLAELPASMQTFLLTSGGCSCGLYMRQSTQSAFSSSQLRDKYVKKGWSEAKIQRAVSQAESAHSRTTPIVGFHPDVADLCVAIAQRAISFGLLIHWYDGDLHVERVDFKQSQLLSITNLYSIVPEEDRMLWIVPANREAGG